MSLKVSSSKFREFYTLSFLSKRRDGAPPFVRIHLLLSVFVLLFVFGSHFLHATISEGQSFGREMMNRSGNVATSAGITTTVPQYTNNPQEAALTESTLTDQTSVAARQNEASTLVQASEQERGRFNHLTQDPLVNFSKELTQNPLELLSRFYQDCHEVPLSGGTSSQESEQFTCEEAGESYPLSCTRDLHIEVVNKVKTYAYTRVSGKQFKRQGRKYGRVVAQTRGPHEVAHDAWYDYQIHTQPSEENIDYFDGCTHYPHTVKNYYTYSKGFEGEAQTPITETEYNSRTLDPQDIRERWTSTCDLFEEKVDSGLCQYASKVCTQGPQTRTIGGSAVSRDCWQETYNYDCKMPAKDDCEPLRTRGCHQVGSQCKQWIGQSCVLYDQTYQCLKPLTGQGQGAKSKIICGKSPQCLSGDCVNQGYSFNSEMGDALAHLSVLREIQNQMKEGLPEIFKGTDERCSRNIASFKDCCGKGGGWGRDLGLASCSDAEKMLCQKRQKRQCHRIGTYCSKRVLGVCTEKKTTFCCFGSGFMRSIVEQGRTQIGLSWGGPENPVCRGFTLDEISRINFSQMDVEEILGEILGNYKQPTAQALGQTIGRRMGEIQESLQQDPKAPQRVGGG